MNRILVIILLTLFFNNANSNALPDFDAHYKLYKSGLNAATTHLSLRQSAGQYIYKSNSKTAGLVSVFRNDTISEISHWKFNKKNQIIVSDYTYKHMKGKKRKKYRNVRFNWSENIAINKYKNQTKSVKLKPTSIDGFTLQLALMLDLKKNKKQLDYLIVDDGRIKNYHFSIIGKEQIKTAAGTYQTIKLKRVRKNKKRTTYMWCAPKLNYLPVKIQHVEKNGSKFGMELTSVKGI